MGGKYKSRSELPPSRIPLTRAESGILHYLIEGWIIHIEDLEVSQFGTWLDRDGFDCYVPVSAVKSLLKRGLIEPHRILENKYAASEDGYWALN